LQSVEAAERTLFHGIKWRHFDSIARSNIDWRATGFSHGVMFGQGKSYGLLSLTVLSLCSCDMD